MPCMGTVQSSLIPEDETIAIFGVGLIGGSIAAALKKRGFTGRILGVGRNASRLENAKSTGLIDACSTNPQEAAEQAGLILLCTPVDLIVSGVREIAGHCCPGTLISDAGSTKAEICRELSDGLPQGVTFLGGHPLAGSEQQGFEQAASDLFDDRVCVLTPDQKTPPGQLSRLRNFWEFLGSRVVEMGAEEHDRALARTSHLPHVAASSLALLLESSLDELTAGGFRDTTRIAAGNPDLWSAILLANANDVTRSIEDLSGKLKEFQLAIKNHDQDTLKKLLQLAKTNRDRL